MSRQGLAAQAIGENSWVVFTVYVWPDGDDDRAEAAANVQERLDAELRRLLSDRQIRDYQLRPEPSAR